MPLKSDKLNLLQKCGSSPLNQVCCLLISSFNFLFSFVYVVLNYCIFLHCRFSSLCCYCSCCCNDTHLPFCAPVRTNTHHGLHWGLLSCRFYFGNCSIAHSLSFVCYFLFWCDAKFEICLLLGISYQILFSNKLLVFSFILISILNANFDSIISQH
jgi:hypothetical protein